MARDYTKYNVEGLEGNLNKRQLVYTVVKDWANKNNPSFDAIQKAFPDEVQGSKGFICKESEVKDPKRFNMREPIKIKNGALVVVSNQWGDNTVNFLKHISQMGYTVVTAEKEKLEDEISSSQEVVNESKQQFELPIDNEVPYSFLKALKNNRKSEDYLTRLDEALERKLALSHEYYGIAKVVDALTNRYYEDEQDEFALEFSYQNDDYNAAFRICDDELELLELLKDKNLIDHILELEDIDPSAVGSIEFKLYYVGYFKLIIEQIAYCEDAEMLAELLFSQSLGYSKAVEESGYSYGDDWLVDLSTELMDVFYGIDISSEDYESGCSLNGNYFGICEDPSYDYVAAAQEIIDQVI